ncbi:MAG: patatin-like phospholipase family protein [Treponema sp.]|jgi:NTE family protein|nr:patatin-like phospholipase family protein [Treponema sp.]
MNRHKELKWALVLSGGGAKGLAHIGVLKALEEMDLPGPSLVAGTSMGAIIGGLYACGMSPREMAGFVIEEFDIADYLDGFAFKLNGPVGKVFQTGQIVGNLATKPGIDSGQRLLQLFERLTRGKTFEETLMPFRCNAVDIVTGHEAVFGAGSVARAMRASMSFPAFFAPFIEGNSCFMDGGLLDNMPVHIPRDEGFKRVLAVNVIAFHTVSLASLRTGPQVLYRSLEVALQSMTQRNKPQADLTLYASDKGSPFNFARKKEFIALGEQAVRISEKHLEFFFSKGIGSTITWKRYRECGIISDVKG